MRRRTIEKRLFDAVLLVLAGSGCWSTTQPAPPREAPPDRGDGDQVIATGAQADPKGLCDAYRERAQIDPSTATPAPPHPSPLQPESASWDATKGVVRCTLVRDQNKDQVEILHTPTCCPMSTHCPAAYKMKVAGSSQLLEHVELKPDGAVASQRLVWLSYYQHPPRHNCGRRPEGLRFAGDDHDDPDDVGAQLAQMAELEAASVPAFERLARELAWHGAPDELIERARRAIGDEVRHARAMRELAAAYGCAPREVAVPPLPCRALAAIARENAIEGCVREAYGALVATYQAMEAAPALRAAFAAIAADERAHAQLAEDVHAWILGALAREAADAVIAARTEAERELRAGLAATPACDALGIPGGARAVALFDAYFA